MKYTTRRQVQRERNAWANALKALHELKRQGITIFAGTKEELFNALDRRLATYEIGLGDNIAPTERHFTRSLSNNNSISASLEK